MLQLRAELFQSLSSVVGLRTALQYAIELEHATIPPYLYALYSIKPGANTAIAGLVRSVVMDEMAHFALACNLLNSIGGTPSIDRPNFVPPFPGPLPGGVHGGLQVELKALSLPLVHDLFMVIEEPERPLEFPVAHALTFALPPNTIGQFYRAIRDEIKTQGPSVFTGDAARQIEADAELPSVVAVTAMTFQTELPAPERFTEPGEVAKMIGLAPLVQESGERRREGRLIKAGNRRLRTILVEAASAAL